MKSDDFVELYEMLRGARSANQILDAEASFMQKDYAAALQTLQFTRDGYHKGHLRYLRDESASNPALQTKRDKINRILSRFDSLIAQLTATAEKHPAPLKHPDLPDQFVSKYNSADTPDDRLDLVYLSFDVSPIANPKDIEAGALYFIATEKQTFLVLVDDDVPEDGTVPIRGVDTGKRLKSMSREQFLELGKRGWLVRLNNKTPPKKTPQRSTPPPVPQQPVVGAHAEAALDVTERDKILDTGAFTQLLDSALRSGMLPGADQIGQIRDREFRRGHFQKALLTMEGLQGKFSAAAANKQAEIRREDAAIASGRLKMSPKDLQAKRMRDQTSSQSIERARSRFSRVLDGLRVLARTMDVSQT